ncbi:MAG: hypothetical protein WD673_12085 [Alphaproteobacteria bacterium]
MSVATRTPLNARGDTVVPFDLGASADAPNWRDGLAWPLDVRSLAGPLRRASARLLAASLTQDDAAWRDAALLMLPGFANRARAILLAARTLEACKATGIRLVGGPPELNALRGDGGGLGADGELVLPGDRVVPPRWRAWVRAASWTPLGRLPRAWLAPGAVAVTHNPLLAATARRGTEAIGFVHAARILAEARSGVPVTRPDTAATAAALTDALLGELALAPPYRERAAALIEALAQRGLTAAARDLAGLGRFRRLPLRLWSGTGGHHAARAIGLAVRARGGAVTRFAHGGSLGAIDMIEQLAATELAVSDRFVVPSDGVRRLIDQTRGIGLPVLTLPVTLEVGARRHTEPRSRSRPRAGRPTVMYVTTAALGLAVHAPPFLPDVVYLDWQLRVAETLGRLPIRLVAKPHPEGLLRGRGHPLADVAETWSRPFESVMADADAFVFDYPCSTTFWAALATDRPVVYLDLGLVPFARLARPHLERRCRVVPVGFDERNLPVVPAAALSEALHVLAPVDPSPWTRLLDDGEP